MTMIINNSFVSPYYSHRDTQSHFNYICKRKSAEAIKAQLANAVTNLMYSKRMRTSNWVITKRFTRSTCNAR